jgi:hypothetical protein
MSKIPNLAAGHRRYRIGLLFVGVAARSGSVNERWIGAPIGFALFIQKRPREGAHHQDDDQYYERLMQQPAGKDSATRQPCHQREQQQADHDGPSSGSEIQ